MDNSQKAMKTFAEWFTKAREEMPEEERGYLDERKIAMHLAWSQAVIETRNAQRDGTFDIIEALQ